MRPLFIAVTTRNRSERTNWIFDMNMKNVWGQVVQIKTFFLHRTFTQYPGQFSYDCVHTFCDAKYHFRLYIVVFGPPFFIVMSHKCTYLSQAGKKCSSDQTVSPVCSTKLRLVE